MSKDTSKLKEQGHITAKCCLPHHVNSGDGINQGFPTGDQGVNGIISSYQSFLQGQQRMNPDYKSFLQ